MRGIILGTGPSVTPEVIEQLQSTRLPIFGCNNSYQIATLTALLSCNIEWWDYYWKADPELREASFDKWTWSRETADKYDINYIAGDWGDGLSTTPGLIHYGHSSGYQILNLATVQYGVTEAILVGYDLRYPGKYDGTKRINGGARHYFGEYPKELQHWTRFNMGENGELNGLLTCYRGIKTGENLRIINCSPGSALDFFEMGRLSEWI